MRSALDPQFYTALGAFLERRIALIFAADERDRRRGPVYSPRRYGWRSLQLASAYPHSLREPATDQDVRTCPKCRAEIRLVDYGGRNRCPRCRVVFA